MEKTKSYSVGEKVHWKWAGGVIKGQVEEIHFAPIEKEIKGSRIKRNGSVEKPAYLVRSEAGNIALKLHTELFVG
jgi:Hypervirulence associated proteins TUDOR domain